MPKQGHNGSKWLAPKLRLAIYIRDGFRCAYCMASIRGMNRDMVTLDHLISGAGDAPKNLVCACKPCNSAKGNRPYFEYIFGLFADRRTAIRRVDRIHRLIASPVGPAQVEAAKAMLAAHAGEWPV